MLPRTISASSLKNFRECPKKFKAVNIEYIDEAREKIPAQTGSAVHYALEHFVDQVFLKKTASWDDEKLLLDLYNEGYTKEFGTADYDTDPYRDGLALTKKWYARTDLTVYSKPADDYESPRTVLSVEKKLRTPVPSHRFGQPGEEDSSATVPMTYIFDRCDTYIDERGRVVVEVVDYKTEQAVVGPDDVQQRLQCKIYAVCAAILHAKLKPQVIKVTLDMLRHDGVVSTTFSTADNMETWKFLRRELQLILDTAEAPKGRPGSGCYYCPIKAGCEEFGKNRALGGIFSIDDLDEVLAKREEIKGWMKGGYSLLDELDQRILAEARERQEKSFEEGGFKIKLKGGSERKLDSQEAARVLPPEVVGKVATIGVTMIDKIIKNKWVDEATAAKLQSLMVKTPKKSSIEVELIAIREEGAA